MTQWRVTAMATAPGDFPELILVSLTVIAADIIAAIKEAHTKIEQGYVDPIYITAAEEVRKT